ncbi:MAG: class I SAM-dependent methyltransferase, partial [Actinomycetales bacterium]
MTLERSKVIASQDTSHGVGHDYVKGSPHLRHDRLRRMVEDRLGALVRATVERTGSCHVLEIGAGHGTFTDTLLEAGARVTVTEVSEASAELLTARYAGVEAVEVFHDTTGESVFELDRTFDATTCISLLHHIPDYVSFVERLAGMIGEGGWFYSVQDPTYYPRRTRVTRVLGRGTYFVWRLGQGDMRRGLATRWRRLRGEWSETEPSDLVEYHVVRSGVDEQAVEKALLPLFDDVDLFTYWSTQSP